MPAIMEAVPSYKKRPRPDFGCNIYHPLAPGNRLEFTCGHCQFICHPDKKVRQERHKMITTSGVVIQGPDGYMKAVEPEAAEAYIMSLDPETRTLYE